MAAVYDLASMLAPAAATIRAFPSPTPVSSAPVSPVAATALPAFDPNAQPDAPARDPNASGFANLLASFGQNNQQNAALAQFQGGLPKPGGIDRLTNFFGGNDATTAKMDEQARTFDFYHDPNTTKYLAAHPDFINAASKDPLGFAAKLQPVIEAATTAHPATVAHAGPAGTVTKTVPDPAHLAAVAAITGEPHDVVNPWLNHPTYTDDEFINATQGLNWKQAARMFGAAQRLTPQQQITNQYAGILHDNAAQAEAAYQAAAAKSAPKGTLDQLNTARTAANDAARAFLKKISEGSNVVFPDSAVQ